MHESFDKERSGVVTIGRLYRGDHRLLRRIALFCDVGNAATLLRNSVELLLVGLGMTLLLAMGGIDVSVGIVMGLAAIGVGRALGSDLPVGVTALADRSSVRGSASSPLPSWCSAASAGHRRHARPAGGLSHRDLRAARRAMAVRPADRSYRRAGGDVPRHSGGRLHRAAYSCVVWLALRRTPYGLHLLAIGNSEEKARLSGIPVVRVRFATFIVSGALTVAKPPPLYRQLSQCGNDDRHDAGARCDCRSRARRHEHSGRQMQPARAQCSACSCCASCKTWPAPRRRALALATGPDRRAVNRRAGARGCGRPPVLPANRCRQHFSSW